MDKLDAQHSQGLIVENKGMVSQSFGYTAEQVTTIVATTIAEISRERQSKPYDGRKPYPGLMSFCESDAPFFFGREALVQHLLARVSEMGNTRFLCITGASGSGKSSLVRAGLIHQLRQGALDGSADWRYAECSPLGDPQSDPLTHLAHALARLTGLSDAGERFLDSYANDPDALSAALAPALTHRDQRAVIFVDQFEELFTQTKDPASQAAFVAQLTRAAQQLNGRVIVLLSLRSDFVSPCLAFPELSALLRGGFEPITAMTPAELTRAIVQPALAVGLSIEPKLAAQVISDMRGEPGALPLMQFALRDLLAAQALRPSQPAELTLRDYLERGGIHQALQRHADGVFARLDAQQKALVRGLFARLISPGRGTVDTRRTVLMAQLVPAGQPAASIEALVQTLADARLLTTAGAGSSGLASSEGFDGARTVTIAHESLLESWPWLAQLRKELRAEIELQNEISDDAAKWAAHGRDASYVYRDAQLGLVAQRLTEGKLSLDELSLAFVQAGQQQQRRAARLRRAFVAGLVVVALVASGLAGLAYFQARRANRETLRANENAQRAEGQKWVARALLQDSVGPQFGLLRAAKALDLAGDDLSVQQQLFERVDSPLKQGVVYKFGNNASSIVMADNNTYPLASLASTLPVTGYWIVNNDFQPATLWTVQGNKPISKTLSGKISSVDTVISSTLIQVSYLDNIEGELWYLNNHAPISYGLNSTSSIAIAWSPQLIGINPSLSYGSPDFEVDQNKLWTLSSNGLSTHNLPGRIQHISVISPTRYVLAYDTDSNLKSELWDLDFDKVITQPLAGQVDFVQVLSSTMFVIGYYDAKGEIWLNQEHQLTTQILSDKLGMPITQVSSDMVVVTYMDGTRELRHISRKTSDITKLPRKAERQCNVEVLSSKLFALCSSNINIELWKLEGYKYLTKTLSTRSSDILRISKILPNYFIVQHRDPELPDELVTVDATGLISRNLSGKSRRYALSETTFIISYEDTPDELWSLVSGELISKTIAKTQSFNAFTQISSTLYIARFANTNDELWSLGTNHLVTRTLSGNIQGGGTVFISPTLFLLSYNNAPGEIWHLGADGFVSNTLASTINYGDSVQTISNSLFVVKYDDVALRSELWSLETNQLSSTKLFGPMTYLTVIAPNEFVVQYSNYYVNGVLSQDELWLKSDTGMLISRTLTSKKADFGGESIDRVYAISPNLFSIRYSDNRSELWNTNTLTPLFDLGFAAKDYLYLEGLQQLLVSYSSNRVVAYDVPWLRTINVSSLNPAHPDDTIRRICAMLKLNPTFTTIAMHAALDGEDPPTACMQ